MPSTSPKQARYMAAIAHGWNPPGKDVPVKVARKFNREDTGTKMLAKAAALRRKG